MNKKLAAYRYGMNAESLAAWYLRAKGYRIIASRYRNPLGEIDLVALKSNMLVAIEVKARKSFADCEDAVTSAKQEKIARAVSGLVAGHGKIAGLADAANRNIRFDVIWVAPRRLPRHIKDAWRL